MKNARISMCFIILASLLNCTASLAQAYEDNCCETVYDCGDPLNCGAFNIAVRVGAAPTLWRERGNLSLISCNGLAIPAFLQNIVNLFELPKFNQLFHTPWIIGGWIGYAVTNNVEFYLELNYRQASSRSFAITNLTVPNDVVNLAIDINSKYKVFDAYIGARYYWGRCWCDRIAFFLGGQFGLVHRKTVLFDLVAASQLCTASAALTTAAATPFAYNSTSPASGLNVGFDYCVGCGWSLFVMAEAIATCGPRTNGNIPIAPTCSQLPALLPSNIIVGGIGTEIFFPVTIGLKYSF